jgi:hypothetical protein
MLEKNPDLRPQSAAELAAELGALQSAGAATGPTVVLDAKHVEQPKSTAAERKRESRPHWPIALIVGVVIALAGMAAFWGSQTAQRGTTAQPTARPTGSAIVIEQDPTPSEAAVPAAPLIHEPAALLAGAQPGGPESFSIGGVSHKQNNGTLWFFGEVRNDGSAARESIELRVNLLDAAGKEIASKVGYASMSYLKPGEISPFSVLFSKDDAPPLFASYKIEVRSTKADFKPGYTYRDLSILPSPQVRQDEYGFITISGRVHNDGEQAAKFVQVYAVFYDQQGSVVGLASTFAEEANDAPLDAGGDARFEVQGIIFSGTPSRYRLFAEGSQAG